MDVADLVACKSETGELGESCEWAEISDGVSTGSPYILEAKTAELSEVLQSVETVNVRILRVENFELGESAQWSEVSERVHRGRRGWIWVIAEVEVDEVGEVLDAVEVSNALGSKIHALRIECIGGKWCVDVVVEGVVLGDGLAEAGAEALADGVGCYVAGWWGWWGYGCGLVGVG
ncbi:hypothetical protein KIMH_13900 [Bombiscardovia apis]|uniref:Uncharacterized protein n=1 Tax=Bombiscardovia apis TaxID=2932182 RepID=A0ABN6SGZ7_9BIFI|nr:hypothetical protein KIMH_13900 [Bombiscardovia apis]